MTDEGFRRVQTFSSDWHGNTFAGATVRRLSRAMWGYDVVADSVVVWIGPALLVLLGLSVQMILRWPVVGVFALVMVTIYIASNVTLSNLYVRKAQRRSIAFDSRIGGALADAIASNPTVKGFGAEDREEARIHLVTDDWRVATNRTWNLYTDVWLVQGVILGVLQAGLSGLMILRWTQGKASAGDVAFVITSFLVMSGYLRNIGDNIRMMQRGLADIEDVAGYARTAPQVADAPDAVPFVGQDGAIVFDHVGFAYGEGKAAIYSDFSLAIRPGERVALVGPTGSGKSTFVKLIQRLYDLDAGRILIDGQDISGVTQRSLRRAIAVVPQDPALFHRTIAENIAYSRPDATHEEIVLAARRAHAHAFIEALPKGYATLVGERGGQALRRGAPARGDRPRPAGRRPDSGAGRGDIVPRRRDGGRGPGRDRGGHGRPHDHPDRPPPLHHPKRRPHPGVRPRPGGRGRPPRRTGGQGRGLRPAERRRGGSVSAC